MDRTCYIARSHGWLRAKLFEHAALPDGVRMVEERDDADLIVYLDPPWPDRTAPDRLRGFSPRQLARTLVYSQSDTPVAWAPGMYASLERRSEAESGPFSGGFYVVQHLRQKGGLSEHLQEARSRSPDLLWSFMGTTENAPVRQRLLEIDDPDAVVEDTERFSTTLRWAWDSVHREEAQATFRRYATTLGRSKFIVCPRGRGASSIRIFEALEMGRCPVIVADGWLRPPFVDWDACSITVPERSAHEIPRILRAREPEAIELGKNARDVWERFFSPEKQLATLVLGCFQINDRINLGARVDVAARAVLGPATARYIGARAWRRWFRTREQMRARLRAS